MIGVKGKKVIVKGSDVEKGLYYVVSKGKKKGIIRVLKTKGSKGLAKLLKGKAAKGYRLVIKRKKKRTAKKSRRTRVGKSRKSFKKRKKKSSRLDKNLKMGIMLSYGTNSSTVKYNDVRTEDLSGTGIGFKLFADYPILNSLHVRMKLGTHPFIAKSEAKEGEELLEIAVSYLSAGAAGKYIFNPGSKTQIWLGGGMSMVLPLDKGEGVTTAINIDQIASTTTFSVLGGLDFQINEQFFAPISVEYSMFPPSEDVSANSILFNFGLGMKF